MAKHIEDEKDFKNELEKAQGLVVVDFYATWCGPCKMIAPKLDAFAKEYEKVTFLKVDVDKQEVDVLTGANTAELEKKIIQYSKQ